MSIYTLRKIEPSDIHELQNISRTTFRETFEAHNSAEDLNKYLHEQLSLDKLSGEIQNSDSAFYFAEINNQAVGYLKLNWGLAQTEQIDASAFEIERIYVLNSYLGKGLGAFLMDAALEIAYKMNPVFIWLGVWEKNERAIHFYEKYGFKVFGSHQFTLGEDIQTDLLMKLENKRYL